MAIFGNTKEDKDVKKADEKSEVKAEPKKADTKKESAAVGIHDVSWVLRKTRITEKSAISAESKVYVFEVDPRANKKDIARAIKESYKVTPTKVNIAKVPSKKVTRRKRTGTTSGVKSGKKKAYVFLDKKDSIEFV